MALKGLHFSVLLVALLLISAQVVVKADQNTNGKESEGIGKGNANGEDAPQMAETLGLRFGGGRTRTPKTFCFLCAFSQYKQCCGFRCCSQEEFDLYAKNGHL